MAKKPPTKADVVLELKLVKKLNDSLEAENKRNLDMIKILEAKVLALENDKVPQFFKTLDVGLIPRK